MSFGLNNIGVIESDLVVPVGITGGLILSTKQENYIREHSKFFDQINSCHWITVGDLRFCAFLHPYESQRDDIFDLQQLVDEL